MTRKSNSVRSRNSNPITTVGDWVGPQHTYFESKDNIPAAQIAEQEPSASKSQYSITADGLLGDCLHAEAEIYRDKKTKEAIAVINNLWNLIKNRSQDVTVTEKNGFTIFSGTDGVDGFPAGPLLGDTELLRVATELCKNEGVELTVSFTKRKWSMKIKI
ncbi:uncharacterized protein SPPG_07917 [Spizellomyces punctatus DAOM BR117]|uniref:Uncharacterized protein n=1 Tax=Spizellomyces punctatus (strain DAOM BR117) TaxID=645134 RepID=A0A0L0H5C4_SPIPD|nr:uncharacterized protein SPPG_07917 [Spizellomyces punctatus DAOM BR117]KNC96705.1 hypothetical protein SPPG_07917 [Spizellomyces punctatus DAOM BR117]|eukprot:XP_016604745.1 hypothetical protein SPPG_07917 [Spizellomyces punctatus DAOM BR117]